MFALVIGSLFLLVRGFRALNVDLDSPERRVAIWASAAKLDGENPSGFL
jgi:hypothetical protein